MMEFNNNWLKKNLKTGDYIDYAVEFCRQNLKTFFVLLVMFHVPIVMITAFLTTPESTLDLFVGAGEGTMDMHAYWEYVLGNIFTMLYSSTIYLVVQLAIINLTYRSVVLDDNMTPKQSLKSGFKRFGWMILWMIVLESAIGIILTPLIVVFTFIVIVSALLQSVVITVIVIALLVIVTAWLLMYLSMRVAFVPHGIIVNQLDCFKACKQSFKLTKKKTWRVFKLYIISELFVITIPSVLGALNYFLRFEDPMIMRVISSAMQGLSAFIAPISIVIMTFMYIKLQGDNGEVDFLRKMDHMLEDKKPENVQPSAAGLNEGAGDLGGH